MTSQASRREFLRQCSAFGVYGAAAPLALNLAAIGSASAQAVSDYKAIVCLFMFGGNDCHNTVVPYDQAPFDVYAAARSGIAYSRASLAATAFTPTTAQTTSAQFALAPQMTALHSLILSGKAAVMANVGPLVVPTTRTNYNSVPKPPKLYSHNDQVSVWQAYAAEGVRSGWGGRMGDLLASNNSQQIFTCISVSGNSVFLAGQNTFQYQVGTSGATKIVGLDASSYTGSTGLFGLSTNGGATSERTRAGQALRALITDPTNANTSLIERDQVDVVKRSINAADTVTAALPTAAPANGGVLASAIPLPTALANNRLAQQLQLVARMIGANAVTGARRQIFFVSIGGFDTHDNQLTSQANLLASVSDSIKYFYDATVTLGLQNNATLFTASDFGRTLTSNGDGSDHGWGAHHFVVGGAVRGGDIYGTMPAVRLHTTANPNLQDQGSGRLIPTTSVDQLAATLGTWFGVQNSDLSVIAPNIASFNPNLGLFV